MQSSQLFKIAIIIGFKAVEFKYTFLIHGHKEICKDIIAKRNMPTYSFGSSTVELIVLAILLGLKLHLYPHRNLPFTRSGVGNLGHACQGKDRVFLGDLK